MRNTLERIFKLSRVTRKRKLMKLFTEILMPPDWYFKVNHQQKYCVQIFGFCGDTVTLQIFGVVLFSVGNHFTEIKKKKTPKWEKFIAWSQQHSQTPKFKWSQPLRELATEIWKITVCHFYSLCTSGSMSCALCCHCEKRLTKSSLGVGSKVPTIT